MVDYQCKICGKLFRAYQKRIVCSRKCTGKYLSTLYKGMEQPKELNIRRSKTLKGKVSPMKGRKQSDKWREAISLANKGNKFGSYKRTIEFKNKLSEYWRNNKEKHNHWKGGITPLALLIRQSLESREWKRNIFERDNYTCQECYIKNGNGESIYMEAHHVKRFSIILQEFLNFYNQFSLIEDKETLLRLSFSYKPFWDIENGKTLCNKCHDKTRGLTKKESVL